MSYLVLIPCMFAVYCWTRKNELSGSYFATVTLLLTVVFANSHWFVAGVDTLVATCLTMALASVAQWYVDREFAMAIEAGQVELPRQPATTLFCSTSNHDFAIDSAGVDAVVQWINADDCEALVRYFANVNPEERQGLYASIDYSKVSLDSAANFQRSYPSHLDANILYGHMKLCEAKQHGLVPGVIPVEAAAAALAIAFKHFRIAQRLQPDDAESLCGLIITKGCVALKDEQIEASLKDLLEVNELHIHGMMSAARFLIKSPEKANRFVRLVENCSGNELTTAIAGLIAHIECGGVVPEKRVSSGVIADMYKQLRVYRRQHHILGGWQRAICNNLIAFAFEKIGDHDEASRHLDELQGRSSPYPWRRAVWSAGRPATVAF